MTQTYSQTHYFQLIEIRNAVEWLHLLSYAINYNLVSDLVMPYNIEPRDRDTLVALGTKL